MAPTDEFYVDDQLNYEAVTGEEGEEDGEGEDVGDDPELEAIKARVREMDEETEKLRKLQSEVVKQLGFPPVPNQSLNLSFEEKMDVDSRSVFIGNVDYGASAHELEQHFHGCGSIVRVTIQRNKFDGHPKGFAYVEFTDTDSVSTSMALDDSLFRGRQIKVMPKRTNQPGISTTNRPPRGRGSRGRGQRGRGFDRGYMRRPRGGYRGRGASYYSPY